ncbi:Bardet-Biedl syndrome 2 protein homolog [Halichondria panicea]|uniref:Bardet-Biedl syndrome 2 protein homolog n=1 Tax=Halichondria panicea TaxID=6063 RepID=UPI00312B68C8
MNEDGVPEVITGWSSGKVDVRSSQTGNVIYKDTFSSTVAGIVQADYRLDGKEELICCSVEGEVRGYLPASMGMVSQQHSLSLGPESKALQELTKRRQVCENLTMELKNFEINEKVASSKDPEGEVGVSGPMGVIPASTMLKTKFGVIIPDGETQGNASVSSCLCSILVQVQRVQVSTKERGLKNQTPNLREWTSLMMTCRFTG